MKYTVFVTYELHQIHITYYGVSTYINDVVIGTWKCTVCSQHVSDWYMIVHVTDVSTCGLYSMLVACFRLVLTIVPVSGVGTWVLYIKWIICMIQVWVHCAGISCSIACYGIGTIIPDCDCQHGIFYYRIHCSRLGISDMNRFCWVKFQLFLCSSWWVWWENLPFFNGLLATLVWIFNLNLELETCAGDLDL